MAKLLLLQAAKIGDLEEIRKLLDAGHDIEEKGDLLTKEDLQSLRWILNEAGVKDAAKSVDRAFDYTPLMAAINEGYFEVAEALLDAGADHNATDSLLRSPLMLAVQWRNLKLVQRLIDAGASLDAKDKCGDPVLTQAINNSAWQIVEKLLDAGANPVPQAKMKSAPLMAASYGSGKKASQVFQRLLEMGTELAKSGSIDADVWYRTALSAVENRGGCDAVNLLLDAGVKPRDATLLAEAASSSNMPLIRRLVEAGSPLIGTAGHNDPLTQAAYNRDDETIRFLLESGAMLVERSGENGVLWQVAYSGGDDDASEAAAIATAVLLVAAGANVGHANDDGKTPLLAAVNSRRPRLARWLLERGANPNRCEYGLNTPLDRAIQLLDRYERDLVRQPDPKRNAEARRGVEQLPKIIEVLRQFGGRRADESMRAGNVVAPILSTPVAERRGLCSDNFFKAHQIMILADIDKISDALEKDKRYVRVERDVYARLDKLNPPVGDVLALIKLKGHSWVYVADARGVRGDSPMKVWSKKIKCPVLYAGEQSVAGVVFYALYDRGKCVEAFESDGHWFRGGLEIDPDVQEESDRMHGTSFSSLTRDFDEIEWSSFESEWDFLDKFLQGQDAYLTFMCASVPPDKRAMIAAYHDDEGTNESIERVDFVYYKPTAGQKRLADAMKETGSARAGLSQVNEDRLLDAIRADDIVRAKEAIEAGAELNQLPMNYGLSYLVVALGRAGRHGNFELVDHLLKCGADPNFGGDEPPLPRLISLGSGANSMELALRLLSAGADIGGCSPPNKRNPFLLGGQTALHKAAACGLANVVKLLLRHGGDPALVDGRNDTPIDAGRRWLKTVKEDQSQEVPGFTDKLHLPLAQETIDLLVAAERGELDFEKMPSDEDLIQAEKQLSDERRKV